MNKKEKIITRQDELKEYKKLKVVSNGPFFSINEKEFKKIYAEHTKKGIR